MGSDWSHTGRMDCDESVGTINTVYTHNDKKMGKYLKLYEDAQDFYTHEDTGVVIDDGGGEVPRGMKSRSVSVLPDESTAPRVCYTLSTTSGPVVTYSPVHNMDSAGVPYVDLGLPSGNLWCTMDLPGLYYWGNTDEWYDGQEPATCSADGRTFYKYNAQDGKQELDKSDDAMHMLAGGDWVIPSVDDWEELFEYTTKSFDSVNKIYTFTSTVNSETIEFPWAGEVQVVTGSGQQYTDQNNEDKRWTRNRSYDGFWGRAANLEQMNGYGSTGLRCTDCYAIRGVIPGRRIYRRPPEVYVEPEAPIKGGTK